MMVSIRTLAASFALLLPAVMLTGCVTATVNVASWEPASADITGLRRIAVTQFEGPDSLTRQLQHEISDALRRSGAYQLCDPTPIELAMRPWRGRSPENVHAALDAARRMGIDSILVGKARSESDRGFDLGTMYVQIGDPELSVGVSYELIDVRTGDIRARRSLDHRFQDELSSRSTGTNSEQHVLARLTHQCLQDLVSEVAPHERQVRVKLAGGGLAVGSGNLRKGNQAAAEGDWHTARREWEMALRDNPDSHAAHYNLGVAAEVAGDLPAAAAAFREAQRRASKELYGDALARVERATRDQQQVFAQRSAVAQLARQPLANEGFQRAGW